MKLIDPNDHANARCAKCGCDLYFSHTLPIFVKCPMHQGWQLFVSEEGQTSQYSGEHDLYNEKNL